MTIPIYDPAVPEKLSDSFATSQPQIQANFQTLFDAFLVNHVSLALSGAGNHTFVELMTQSNPAQTNRNQISVYSRNVKQQTREDNEDQKEQIYFRYSDGTPEFQYTNYQIYKLKPTAELSQFFTFLPGRLIIYFGSFTKLKDNTLFLLPNICKEISGAMFCAIGPPQPSPVYSVPDTNTAFFPQIKIFSGESPVTNPGPARPAPPSHYFIVGNT